MDLFLLAQATEPAQPASPFSTTNVLIGGCVIVIVAVLLSFVREWMSQQQPDEPADDQLIPEVPALPAPPLNKSHPRGFYVAPTQAALDRMASESSLQDCFPSCASNGQEALDSWNVVYKARLDALTKTYKPSTTV